MLKLWSDKTKLNYTERAGGRIKKKKRTYRRISKQQQIHNILHREKKGRRCWPSRTERMLNVVFFLLLLPFVLLVSDDRALVNYTEEEAKKEKE